MKLCSGDVVPCEPFRLVVAGGLDDDSGVAGGGDCGGDGDGDGAPPKFGGLQEWLFANFAVVGVSPCVTKVEAESFSEGVDAYDGG